MKPTDKIIELAKRLNELGYRQKINRGDWFLIKGRKGLILRSNVSPNLEGDTHLIPIPSLEDGMIWLREQELGFDKPTLSPLVDGWDCDFDNYESTFADTPHEAVLKAMIKVLEGKK